MATEAETLGNRDKTEKGNPMEHSYEGKIVLRTDRELTDDELGLFGDAMDQAENLIAGALVDGGLVGVLFEIEYHGPVAVRF